MKSKTLRILMLNYEFPPLGGGASPVSYEIAKGYVKLGHSVDVITMNMKGLKEFEKKDGINIYRVPCWRTKKEICHPWEQYSYLRNAKKFLKTHMKTHTYDINHTHFIIPTGVLALWLKKKFGLGYIITAHGSDVLGYNKRFKYLYPLLISKWKKIVKEAKLVITPSKFLQDKIKSITIQGNFAVIPNGIDKNKFKPLKKQKRILVVARLFENKGVQDILDALVGLDMQGWKIDIVGDGPYRKVLEKKIKENNLSRIVKLRGWVDNNSKEMKQLYGHASIFVSASYFENMSIVLLEALASGCNVLASNVGGNPEVITNKNNLFEVGNVDDLRMKLKRRLVLKSNNKIILDKRFDWGNIVKGYMGVLG